MRSPATLATGALVELMQLSAPLDKLYHVDIIAELVSIFSPRLVWAEQLDAQGNLHTECRMFGSLALVEKYSTLLNKLRMMKVC